jgi:hypothetical protein
MFKKENKNKRWQKRSRNRGKKKIKTDINKTVAGTRIKKRE